MSQKINAAIAAIVLVSAFAAPVAAGTFEDAVDAHARGDYAKALRLIRPLANDGDAAAQFNLGVMYVTGRGVQQGLFGRSFMVSEGCRARLRPRPIQSRDPV
jgi:uncharacterized protein